MTLPSPDIAVCPKKERMRRSDQFSIHPDCYIYRMIETPITALSSTPSLFGSPGSSMKKKESYLPTVEVTIKSHCSRDKNILILKIVEFNV